MTRDDSIEGLLLEFKTRPEPERQRRHEDIKRALQAIPEDERRVIELRFGIDDEHYSDPQTHAAIGRELQMSHERVRQLEIQGLARLSALRELQYVDVEGGDHE